MKIKNAMGNRKMNARIVSLLIVFAMVAGTIVFVPDANEGALSPQPRPYLADHVVISEVLYDDDGTDNHEFVELYNPTADAVDISGWDIVPYNGAGWVALGTMTLPAGQSIPSYGFYLIAQWTTNPNDGSDGADVTTAWGYSITSDCGPTGSGAYSILTGGAWVTMQNGPDAVLVRDASDVYIDAVCYGASGGTYGFADEPETSDPTEGSLERMSGLVHDENGGNGQDTDDNLADFRIRISGSGQYPQPQNSADSETPSSPPVTYADHIVINEILFDSLYPEETGEWVEILNPTGSSVNIAGWTYSDGEGTWTIPTGYSIGSWKNITLAKNGARFYQDYGYYPDFEYSGGTPAVDLTNSGEIYMVNAGEVVWLNNSGGSSIDIVVWGTASFPPITPTLADPGNGQSISRNPDAAEDETAPDDENCQTYWVIKAIPNPRTSDSNAPSVSGVIVTPTPVSCLIAWTTVDGAWPEINPQAISEVSYKAGSNPDTGGNITLIDNVPKTTHEMYLIDLTPSTTYYFFIRSEDGLGQVSYAKNSSNYYHFTTLAVESNPPSILSGPDEDQITDASARVYWTTNEYSMSTVFYGTSAGSFYMSSYNLALTKNNEVYLTGLSASTTYYYAIYSQDSSGNSVYADNGGSGYTFSTLAAITENFYIANLHAHTSYSDGVNNPLTAFTYARDTAQIDIQAITDHSGSLTLTEYNDIKTQANSTTTASFVAIAGQEFGSLTQHGHINILDATSVCPLATSDPMSSVYSWASTARAGSSIAPGDFNHPGMGGDDWEGLSWSQTGDNVMGGFEVYNGKNGFYDGWYPSFMQAGWRTAPLGNQDNHEANWGDKTIDGYRIPFTVFKMASLTRQNVLSDILNNTMYAVLVNSTDKRDYIKMEFEANGKGMGSQISIAGSVNFVVRLSTKTDNLASAFLYEDGLQIATYTNIASTYFNWTPSITPGLGDHWYYVKVIQTDEGEAYSGPIWIHVPAMAQPLEAPSIWGVSHTPSSPTNTQNVTITAHVDSTQEIYRVDMWYSENGGTYQRMSMRDDGVYPDESYGDKIYTAQLPAKADGTEIHYYVQAIDAAGLYDKNPSDSPAHFYSYIVGPHMVINEVYADAYDLVPTAGAEESEMIELYNPTGSAISLPGWTIESTYYYDKWTWPAGATLTSQDWLVIARDSYATTTPDGGYRADADLTGDQVRPDWEMYDSADVYDDGQVDNMVLVGGDTEIKLNNAYDALVLRNPSGTVVDCMEWGYNYSFIPGPPAVAADETLTLVRDYYCYDTDSSWANFAVQGNPTPGLNNTLVTILNVQRAPMCPNASQVVNVSARIADDAAVTNAVIYYCVNNAGSYTSTAMNDAGTAPDLVAGDKIWTGQIPGQTASSQVKYYIEAWNSVTHQKNPYGATILNNWTYQYSVWPHIVISEVYYNSNVYVNDAANSKFIEIYNPTGSSVDISGWVLQGEPTYWARQWAFPASTSIPAGGIYVIAKTAGDGVTTGFYTEFGSLPNFEMYDSNMASESPPYTDTDNAAVTNMNLVTSDAYDDQIELSGASFYDAVYLKNSGGAIIDSMEYGIEAEMLVYDCVIETPADPTDLGYSLTRKSYTSETDKSLVDFVSAVPSPGTIPIPPTASFDISLHAGWNLISVPLSQLNTSIDAVLSSIAGKWNYAQTYNGTFSDPWLNTMPSRPTAINDFTTINHQIGFWLYATEPGLTLHTVGDKPTTTTINLYAGWNLVGFPSSHARTVSDALAGINDLPVEAYSEAGPYHLQQLDGADYMNPGQGYWVYVSADTPWVVTY